MFCDDLRVAIRHNWTIDLLTGGAFYQCIPGYDREGYCLGCWKAIQVGEILQELGMPVDDILQATPRQISQILDYLDAYKSLEG